MSSGNENTGSTAPVTGPVPTGAKSGAVGPITRIWRPYDSEYLEIPDDILEILFQELGVVGEDYWCDFDTPAVGYREVQGNIVMKIWRDREKFEWHDDPDARVVIGYWRDHPEMKGAWYYYFSAEEIRRRLQTALKVKDDEGSA